MALEATSKKGRWEELVNMSCYELLNYLCELGDESDALSMDSGFEEVLAHIVKNHHPEFGRYLEEYLLTKGGTDFQANY
jgi:hypothetical protein